MNNTANVKCVRKQYTLGLKLRPTPTSVTLVEITPVFTKRVVTAVYEEHSKDDFGRQRQ